MLNSDQLTKLSNQLKDVCGQQSPSMCDFVQDPANFYMTLTLGVLTMS